MIRICVYEEGSRGGLRSRVRQYWWSNLCNQNNFDEMVVRGIIREAGGYLDVYEDRTHLVFEKDEDATAFLLRWA